MELLKIYVSGCLFAYLFFWLIAAYDYALKMKKYRKECNEWKTKKSNSDEMQKYPSFFYEIDTEFFVIVTVIMLCSWLGVAFLVYGFVSYYKENL